jgi:hypothetical protein
VFHQTDSFDLSDQVSQIVESDILTLTVKNLTTGKDATTVNCNIILSYQRTEGNIIYNNTYTNLNPDGLANILEDIRKSGKYITKIYFTSPEALSGIELEPQFKSDPEWLNPIKLTRDSQHNHIVVDLSNQEWDADFVENLRYYRMVLPDNVEKLCVVIHGYVH